MALLTPRYWWFLARSLVSAPPASAKSVKFSTRSRRRALLAGAPDHRLQGDHALLLLVADLLPLREVLPPGAQLPTRVSTPFESTISPLYQKSCGIVSL
jgi:hypothetical protein